MKPKLLAAVLLALSPIALLAQNSGYVGIATTSQPLTFTAGVSQVVRNIGQSAHNVSFCTTAYFGTGLTLEASFDGATNWVTIGFTTLPATGCGVLQAGGYYQFIRARNGLLGGAINVTYNGSAAPISFVAPGIGSSGPRAPTTCDRSATVSVANTATAVIITGFPDTGGEFRICAFQISFNGATAAGSYQFEEASDNACSAPNPAIWVGFTTAGTPQTITMGSGLGQLFKPSGIIVCFLNNSGATARVNVSWANVQGPF